MVSLINEGGRLRKNLTHDYQATCLLHRVSGDFKIGTLTWMNNVNMILSNITRGLGLINNFIHKNYCLIYDKILRRRSYPLIHGRDLINGGKMHS